MKKNHSNSYFDHCIFATTYSELTNKRTGHNIRSVWQYGLWSFQTGYTKLERFLPKNQHAKRIFLNFENWTNLGPQKLAKIRVFKVDYFDFSCVNHHESEACGQKQSIVCYGNTGCGVFKRGI